jgi:hypothetical protein
VSDTVPYYWVDLTFHVVGSRGEVGVLVVYPMSRRMKRGLGGILRNEVELGLSASACYQRIHIPKRLDDDGTGHSLVVHST